MTPARGQQPRAGVCHPISLAFSGSADLPTHETSAIKNRVHRLVSKCASKREKAFIGLDCPPLLGSVCLRFRWIKLRFRRPNCKSHLPAEKPLTHSTFYMNWQRLHGNSSSLVRRAWDGRAKKPPKGTSRITLSNFTRQLGKPPRDPEAGAATGRPRRNRLFRLHMRPLNRISDQIKAMLIAWILK